VGDLALKGVNQLFLRNRPLNSPKDSVDEVISPPRIADILKAGIGQFAFSKHEA